MPAPTSAATGVRDEIGAIGIVVRDPLGKTDELTDLPLQSECEFVHPCCLGRRDGVGVETPCKAAHDSARGLVKASPGPPIQPSSRGDP